MKIDFNNLKPLANLLSDEVNVAVKRVFDRGWFILGPEVEAFETAFAQWHGVAHAVGVANGTDAIELALRAANIGKGDEVITVAHTAVATVCAVERSGATPVLVDIDEKTFTMDPNAAAAAITPRTRAIIPVHLYGHPANLTALGALAQKHGLLLMEDCAQAHGATWDGKKVGTFGALASFSFYPTKNLGAHGDGGAILTGDAALAARLKRLRNYGQSHRYHHDERGMNSRLDEVQAAILDVKLKHLNAHNQRRREIAARYSAGLHGVTLPTTLPQAGHVFHLYVVRHPKRDALQEKLAASGVGTLVHYPVPVHRQKAYLDLGCKEGSLPVTERAAREIVSLPLFMGLSDSDVDAVIAAVNTSVAAL